MLNNDIKVWIGVVSLASELVITISHLAIAVTLFRSKPHPKPAYRTLGLIALAVSLCVFREVFGLMETWRIAIEISSPKLMNFSMLKALAAICWVVTAYRLPAILRRLSQPEGFTFRAYQPDDRACQADLRKSEELASEMKQLSLKARMLQSFVRNELWLLNQLEMQQEFIGKRDDVEMIPCKI